MTITTPAEKIASQIIELRGRKVILSAELASLYGVSTKRLNEQVKRNQERLPDDFAFRLTKQEQDSLRSQFATSKGRGGDRYLPTSRQSRQGRWYESRPAKTSLRARVRRGSRRNAANSICEEQSGPQTYCISLLMFPLKYLNRHLFMEHAGRLYLVDTGCPRSFAINGVIPWADRTPHAVFLDMQEGRLRFAGDEADARRYGVVFPFTKAPGTMAPIFYTERGFKMIWDTGAQLGYIDMSTVPDKDIVKKMGAFVDFSPVYGPIESPSTSLVRFMPYAVDAGGHSTRDLYFEHYFFCQMAAAPDRILADIRKEGADGVLGNSWMDKDSLTGMLADVGGENGRLLVDHTDGVCVAIFGRKSEVRIQNLPCEMFRHMGWPPRRHTLPRKVPLDLFEPATVPVTATVTPKTDPLHTVARGVPSSLGPFTAEGLRGHLGLDNIDGLIGNDLLQDTVL